MAIDAQTKDDIFRNPESAELHFGRQISTVCVDGTIVSAIQEENGELTKALLLVQKDGQRSFIESPAGMVHQPFLAVSQNNEITLAWNEADNDGWTVKIAKVDLQKLSLKQIETVFKSKELCLAPTAAFVDNELYVAWSGLDNGRFKIHVARKSNSGWEIENDFCNWEVDCFRPQLAAMGSKLLCIWDEYHKPAYDIVFAEYNGTNWTSIALPPRPDIERWLCPRIIANDQAAYLTWLVVTDVIDDLGIIDHDVFAPVVCYDGKEAKFTTDDSNNADNRIVADLREGLLAGEIYKGHVGLRRNPQLSIADDGTLWCFWESRKESPDSAVVGRLVGRCFSNRQWQPSVIFCGDGYCWNIAGTIDNEHVAVGFLQFEATGRDVIQTRKVDLRTSQLFEVNTEKWNRWKKVKLKVPTKPEKTIEIDGQTYKLFWADTHVHSVLSPDAEGEVDELIHFARDIAGLDAICIIDNDYYPHKSLTEAEWRIHQAMAAHFTQPGKFVFLPGYEFTYHRSDLEPDFNHRCVIYPRRGPLLRRIDEQSNNDAKLLDCLKKTDGMAYPHHCSYEIVDNEMEWNIEACSSWRVCLEESDFTIRQLNNGKKLGFVGSSDTHRMSPGLAGARTGLWAEELTPEALFDAYKNRRCLATQGHNILIDFKIDGQPIGSNIIINDSPQLNVYVDAPEKIEFIEIIRDGLAVYRCEPANKSTTINWTDEHVLADEHFYFVRVKLVGDPSLNFEGGDPATNPIKPFSQQSRYPHNLARGQGPFAWSSPIWVQNK